MCFIHASANVWRTYLINSELLFALRTACLPNEPMVVAFAGTSLSQMCIITSFSSAMGLVDPIVEVMRFLLGCLWILDESKCTSFI